MNSLTRNNKKSKNVIEHMGVVDTIKQGVLWIVIFAMLFGLVMLIKKNADGEFDR